MEGFPDRTSRAKFCILGEPVCQSDGMVEENELLLMSSCVRDVRDCHAAGRVPERVFLLRSISRMAFRELHDGGRVPYRLRRQAHIKVRGKGTNRMEVDGMSAPQRQQHWNVKQMHQQAQTAIIVQKQTMTLTPTCCPRGRVSASRKPD